MSDRYDFAIVGAGMAGASLAAELAPHASVVVLEAEDQPGYHATGRSAAFWEECYGGPQVAPLTSESGAYLREHGFLHRRGALYIGRDEDAALLDSFLERFAATDALLEPMDRSALRRKVPGLRAEWTMGLFQPACADIDVAGLHEHYLKRAHKAGADFHYSQRIAGIDNDTQGWRLSAAGGLNIRAGNVVNAAGAWADELAQMAGIGPLGIRPLRRTVAQLRVSPEPSARMPLVLDIAGQFYFKPEHGRLWLSPHDETPSAPVDAAAEEWDVALAIDRLQSVVDWQIEAVERKWAGLRSFAPDRLPVYGRDPRCPSFAWFAGQGGFGIQTAPAAARLMARQLLAGRAGGPQGDERNGISASQAAIYTPGRLI